MVWSHVKDLRLRGQRYWRKSLIWISVNLGFRLQFSLVFHTLTNKWLILQLCLTADVMLWLLKKRDHGRLHWAETTALVLCAVVVLKELLQKQTNSCRVNRLCWLVDSLHVPCLVYESSMLHVIHFSTVIIGENWWRGNGKWRLSSHVLQEGSCYISAWLMQV